VPSSLPAKDDILTIKNTSFGCKCDVTFAKVTPFKEGHWDMSFYGMKLLDPGEEWAIEMVAGDYVWQIECWDKNTNRQTGRHIGELHFPTLGDDLLVIRCAPSEQTLLD
jgi:hypothetical protein